MAQEVINGVLRILHFNISTLFDKKCSGGACPRQAAHQQGLFLQATPAKSHLKRQIRI
jgi:hypothetical protein